MASLGSSSCVPAAGSGTNIACARWIDDDGMAADRGASTAIEFGVDWLETGLIASGG